MEVLKATVIFCLFLGTNAQVHYIPAHVLIPTLNISAFQGLPNTNYTAPVGWMPPYVNNTGANNVNNNARVNQTGWNNPKLNKTFSNGTNVHGDLILGSIGYSDRLLFNQIYFKPARWWSSREMIIEYPADLPGGSGRHEVISAIRAYNSFYDGLGSQAKLKAGGIGYRYAKIKLASTWGKGFKYQVQIFGH